MGDGAMIGRLDGLDQRIASVEGRIGALDLQVAVAGNDLIHMRRSLDSVLSVLRWLAFFVFGGVLTAVLNLVVKFG